MTRILHVLDHSLPLHSGYSFRTRAILKAQQAAGLEPRAVTGVRQGRHDSGLKGAADWQSVDGLDFYRTDAELMRIPVMGKWPVIREWQEIRALARAICDAARTFHPDILHAHSPALCGMAAHLAARELKIPLVYEIRAFWEDAAVSNGTGRAGSVKYRLTRALENAVIARADAIFTICGGLRDDLITRGVAADRIGISPNGVDLDMFGALPEPQPDRAAHLGITGAPVIGFIGSFYDYEGLDDLIAAMPLLHRRHPGAKLLLVGGGPQEHALRRLASESPARDHIVFTDRIAHDEVPHFYALTDILCYPRKKSRLTDLVTPLKPLEAMAQGCLVAASDVGGHKELITHDATGVLFASDDPMACSEALGHMLDHREKWQALRDKGRKHVIDNHDWAENVGRYQFVYHSLLNPKDANQR